MIWGGAAPRVRKGQTVCHTCLPAGGATEKSRQQTGTTVVVTGEPAEPRGGGGDAHCSLGAGVRGKSRVRVGSAPPFTPGTLPGARQTQPQLGT